MTFKVTFLLAFLLVGLAYCYEDYDKKYDYGDDKHGAPLDHYGQVKDTPEVWKEKMIHKQIYKDTVEHLEKAKEAQYYDYGKKW